MEDLSAAWICLWQRCLSDLILTMLKTVALNQSDLTFTAFGSWLHSTSSGQHGKLVYECLLSIWGSDDWFCVIDTVCINRLGPSVWYGNGSRSQMWRRASNSVARTHQLNFSSKRKRVTCRAELQQAQPHGIPCLHKNSLCSQLSMIFHASSWR